MVSLFYFQLLSAALFAIGLYGVLARRSAVLIVMSIELMLNAVNINLIAAASHLNGIGSFVQFERTYHRNLRNYCGGRRVGPGPGHYS